MVKPVLVPARRYHNASIRPADIGPTERYAEAAAITPAAIAPSSSASVTPVIASVAAISPTAAVTPTAVATFTPVRPVYSDSVYVFRSRHLVLCGLRKHFSYLRNPFSDSCVIAGPGTDRACFRLLGKQTSTGRKL